MFRGLLYIILLVCSRDIINDYRKILFRPFYIVTEEVSRFDFNIIDIIVMP